MLYVNVITWSEILILVIPGCKPHIVVARKRNLNPKTFQTQDKHLRGWMKFGGCKQHLTENALYFDNAGNIGGHPHVFDMEGYAILTEMDVMELWVVNKGYPTQ